MLKIFEITILSLYLWLENILKLFVGVDGGSTFSLVGSFLPIKYTIASLKKYISYNHIGK